MIAFQNEDGISAADRKTIAAEAKEICESDEIDLPARRDRSLRGTGLRQRRRGGRDGERRSQGRRRRGAAGTAGPAERLRRRHGRADARPHQRRRLRGHPGQRRRPARDRAGGRRSGAARVRERHRRRRRRLDRGLRVDRRDAAARHRLPRPDPAARDLSLAGDRAGPADRRRLRLHDRRRSDLRARRVRCLRRQLADDEPPDRADVRRRHRLRPADSQPISRGAPPHRGQARGDGAGDRTDRTRDPLGRRHGRRGDDGADPRRHALDPDDGAGARARRADHARRRADAAAGDPRDPRPALVLARDPASQQRAAPPGRGLAQGRPVRARALGRWSWSR